jgi:hypothetical protein
MIITSKNTKKIDKSQYVKTILIKVNKFKIYLQFVNKFVIIL